MTTFREAIADTLQASIDNGEYVYHDGGTVLAWSVTDSLLAMPELQAMKSALRAVAERELSRSDDCTCGYGGFHEPLNKRCFLYEAPYQALEDMALPESIIDWILDD